MEPTWPEWMYELKPFSNRASIGAIRAAVAEQFGVREEDIMSSRRARRFAAPRQAAMTLCATMTGRSLAEIGRAFKRDHTTVMHAQKATHKRMADASFADKLKMARTRALEMMNVKAEVDELTDLLLSELGQRIRHEIANDPVGVLRRLLRT